MATAVAVLEGPPPDAVVAVAVGTTICVAVGGADVGGADVGGADVGGTDVAAPGVGVRVGMVGSCPKAVPTIMLDTRSTAKNRVK